jgi:sulfhydrogenase subunit delta
MVARGVPCLGPVTHAGCGALCPTYNRGCFGCYGPKESPNTGSLAERWAALGIPNDAVIRAFRGINANAGPFREESEKRSRVEPQPTEVRGR